MSRQVCPVCYNTARVLTSGVVDSHGDCRGRGKPPQTALESNDVDLLIERASTALARVEAGDEFSATDADSVRWVLLGLASEVKRRAQNANDQGWPRKEQV